MKNKTTLLLIYIITASLSSVAVNAQVLITDSFETMDMSATNSDGFAWGNNDRTSIVTQHPDDGNVVVFNGNPIYNIIDDSRDWTAYDGDYSLRFRYPAGINSMAEQRFDLGGVYQEIWISYWLRVPTNFEQRFISGRQGKKLLTVWMDGYEPAGDGATAVWGMNTTPTSGGSNTVDVNFTKGNYTIFNCGCDQQSTPFIASPDDQGRWMELVFNLRASTEIGDTDEFLSDGHLKLWRRWNGEANYEQLHDLSDALLISPTAGPNGWQAGYLMGWSNPGYNSDTEWLLDNFTVSKTSLLLSNEDLIFSNGFDSN